jgi:hypothetical protein
MASCMPKRCSCVIVFQVWLLCAGSAAAQRATPVQLPPATTTLAPASAPQTQPDAAAAGPADAAVSNSDEAAFASALAQDAATVSPAPTPNASAPQPSASAGNLLNPDLSAIADFALAAHSQRDNWLQGAHDPAQKGFNLQGLELALGAAVDPYFRFDAIIVFNHSEVEIEEAYATTLDLPGHLQARAGQFLTRFGRLNPTHPHSWDFVDQPFALSRVFGAEGSRGLGAELSWLTPLPWYVEWMASTTTANGAQTARSFLGASQRDVDSWLDLLYVTTVKQFFPLSDDWSLAWGLSGAFGPNDQAGAARTEVYGSDVYLKWKPAAGTTQEALRLQIEVIYRQRRVAGGGLQDANGFAMLAWRFAQRWDAAARYELSSATLDSHGRPTSDYLDPGRSGKRQRASLSVTFFPTEFSRLRVQGNVDRPDDLARPIWSAILGLEVAVGPHRPHPF